MAQKNIARRQAVRAIEARRDKLRLAKEKATVELRKIAVDLKNARGKS